MNSMSVETIEQIVTDTTDLLSEYKTLIQITAPDEQWVLTRISKVKSVRSVQAVTSENDPNGLLGKEGGYLSCIYFTVFQITLDSIPGSDVVAKGTDAGGAVEVYATIEDAKNRCDYLSQFDDTILYSGSYTLVRTMVIRTSYALSDQQQVDLTNEIIYALTEVYDE